MWSERLHTNPAGSWYSADLSVLTFLRPRFPSEAGRSPCFAELIVSFPHSLRPPAELVRAARYGKASPLPAPAEWEHHSDSGQQGAGAGPIAPGFFAPAPLSPGAPCDVL